MKKIVFASLALALGFTIYACSSGDKAANPNDAAEEFANPSGKLTSGNANDVANAAVDSKNSNGISGSAFYLSKNTSNKFDNKYALTNGIITQAVLDECIEVSGNNSTTDWECLAPHIESEIACVGTGTIESTFNDSEDFTTNEYNDWSLNCTGDEDLTTTCSGSQSVSLTSGVVCSNLTCENTDFTLNWEGCVDGDTYLVKLDDDGFVIESVESDAECSTVNLTVRHADGTDTMTCNVTAKSDGCSNLEGVETVASCTIN